MGNMHLMSKCLSLSPSYNSPLQLLHIWGGNGSSTHQAPQESQLSARSWVWPGTDPAPSIWEVTQQMEDLRFPSSLLECICSPLKWKIKFLNKKLWAKCMWFTYLLNELYHFVSCSLPKAFWSDISFPSPLSEPGHYIAHIIQHTTPCLPFQLRLLQ